MSSAPRLVGMSPRQHRPGDAGELVGQRNHQHVAMQPPPAVPIQSHRESLAPCGRRTSTMWAACTNRVLRYLLPRFEILPRIVRSPVDSCLGTSPSQAPKSRPCLNPAPVPIAATTADEMIGLTPGTLMRR